MWKCWRLGTDFNRPSFCSERLSDASFSICEYVQISAALKQSVWSLNLLETDISTAHFLHHLRKNLYLMWFPVFYQKSLICSHHKSPEPSNQRSLETLYSAFQAQWTHFPSLIDWISSSSALTPVKKAALSKVLFVELARSHRTAERRGGNLLMCVCCVSVWLWPASTNTQKQSVTIRKLWSSTPTTTPTKPTWRSPRRRWRRPVR